MISLSPDATTLEVKDEDGATVRCVLGADTRVLKGQKAFPATQLRPGAGVVISLKENAGGPATALEVRVTDIAPSRPQPQVSYTCPMHPEVRTTTPGRCGKCGMNLTKAT